MADNEKEKEPDFSDIVSPSSASSEWLKFQEYSDKINAQARQESKLIASLIEGLMMTAQCACTHLYRAHGTPPAPLDAAKVERAVATLFGVKCMNPCQSCKCKNFEMDNLEWLLQNRR